MKRQDFAILGAPGTGKTTLGAVISSGSLLHVHNEDSMDTSTLQMALIGYQAERHKTEEKIAEIRAKLNGRSWRSRQASSSFSRADLGMRHANLDPDIAASMRHSL
jgi:KaiC/GvpD/RAD55 family RecA-like ATPase